MAWVKIDDHFNEHPKLSKVGPVGVAFWAAGLAYCNRNLTDGFIPWGVAPSLYHMEFQDESGTAWQICIAPVDADRGSDGEVDAWALGSLKVIGMLVAAGIFEQVPGGYQIHDYADYQPTKAQVLEERAQKAAAGRAGGRATARARAGAPATADQVAERQPVPVPLSTNSEDSTSPTVEDSSSHEGRVRDDWIDLSNLMNDLTGKLYAIPNPWSKMAEKAFDLIDRHGWQAFEERARLVAGRVGKNPGVDEIIFGVGNSMRRGVDTADVAKQERAAEAASVTRSRVEKTQLQLHGYGQHGDGPENHPACPSCAEVPV